MEEWGTHTLRELTVNHDGKRKPVKESERKSGPYPYYGASGIVDHVDSYLFDGDYLLVAEDGENLRTRQTPIAFMAKGRFWVNNHAHIVTANEKSDTRFLMYALQVADINAYLTGAVMPKLTQGNLNNIQITLPPLPKQRAIAHILGTLDDKIELNRRTNETLEAMARALFKSWFVDFEPVRIKQSNQSVGRVRRGLCRNPTGSPCPTDDVGLRDEAANPTYDNYLTPEILDLFPDSFEDSELREVPKGWRVGNLADVALLNPESWSKKSRPDFIKYVDLSNTKWGQIESTTVYSSDEAPSRAQRVLKKQDTIVGTVRPGNGSYTFIAEDGLTGSTGFAVLRPKNAVYSEFIYLSVTSSENIESLAHLADGGAYPAVRPEVVSATVAILPCDSVLARFSQITFPTLEKMGKNNTESRTLATLRDTLLPKLLSGEIRVKDAEKMVAEL